MAAIWYAIAEYLVPHLEPSLFSSYLGVIAEWAVNLNLLLLIFNLIPAYPMDGGRILQEILWLTVGYQRSLHVAGMVGTVAGISFVVLGLGAAKVSIPWIGYVAGAGFLRSDYPLGGEVNGMLVVIGIMAATASFGIYRRAQEVSGWRKN